MIEPREDLGASARAGIAFHPNYRENVKFYVAYSAPLRGDAILDQKPRRRQGRSRANRQSVRRAQRCGAGDALGLRNPWRCSFDMGIASSFVATSSRTPSRRSASSRRAAITAGARWKRTSASTTSSRTNTPLPATRPGSLDPILDDLLLRLMTGLRRRGGTPDLGPIAAGLNERGIPTAREGRWSAGSGQAGCRAAS
jgi:hypothetical protein